MKPESFLALGGAIAAMLLLTTPVAAEPDRGIELDGQLLACKDPYDTARLYTLMGQDDNKATQDWYAAKNAAKECFPLRALEDHTGRYYVMENARYQGTKYSCVRPEKQHYCVWTMDSSGL